MDRQIVYPGSIPLDTDLLNTQRNVMIALGYLSQMVLGTNTVVDGLPCLPDSGTPMSVTVGPGSISQFGVVDNTPFGSLPALPGDTLMKLGVNVGPTTLALTAPTVTGQVISYLIQASLLEADTGGIVLPYYNAANPSQPFSGPANTGAPQMTERRQTVQFELKAGPSVPAGNQSLPNVDAGWIGLYVIAVAYGQQSITSANITTLPTAPFIYNKLPQLTPGTQNMAVFKPASQGAWTVPAGVSAVKLRLWGGGGAGGSGFGGAGGGGSGGGYTEGYFGVTAGQTFQVAVGNGGVGAGVVGELSTFGTLASATGGVGGASGSSGGAGTGAAVGGVGSGTGLSVSGSGGADALNLGNAWLSGAGGGCYCGEGALGVTASVSSSTGTSTSLIGRNAVSPGSGGSGGIGAGVGGQGGPGLVIVEW